MKKFIHETVGKILELQALEERLKVFQRNHEKSADTQALIESLRANISVTVLLEHERMRSRGKRSTAEVRHGVCTGCHLRLGIGNAAALKRGELRRCGNCGRFLYLVAGEQEEEAEAAFNPEPACKNTKPAILHSPHSYAHA